MNRVIGPLVLLLSLLEAGPGVPRNSPANGTGWIRKFLSCLTPGQSLPAGLCASPEQGKGEQRGRWGREPLSGDRAHLRGEQAALGAKGAGRPLPHAALPPVSSRVPGKLYPRNRHIAVESSPCHEALGQNHCGVGRALRCCHLQKQSFPVTVS